MGSSLSNYLLFYTIREVGKELPSKEIKLNLEMDTDFEIFCFSLEVRISFSNWQLCLTTFWLQVMVRLCRQVAMDK